MTGEQWSEFIRLLTPGEQQAFMLDVYKIINRYCLRIGGE
jgi:DNA-directed RNA polymerase subunit N (RpoN/RPB10)